MIRTRAALWSLLLLAAYFASGLYIVRGNEQALVRRFGKADRTLAAGGLHLDLPWPLARIERVNVHALRTLSVGLVSVEAFDGAGFLRDAGVDRQAEFLTGDKNILNMQVNVHYTITEPHKYFFGCNSPETGLKLLAESLVTSTVAQSSVDYVHPLGLNELRVLLTQSAREAVAREPWGLAVEDVTIAGVLPPVEVKASFLDVSNARAERDRIISQELARSDKLKAAAEAGANQLLDRAESERLARVEAARGSADRFMRIVEQFRREADAGGRTAADVRRSTMQRMWTATLEELLPRLSRQVLLDPQQSVDLFLVNPPPAPKSAPTSQR
ncbi:MAG: protease modulator HflK [Planctomycetia bacterium]|nr:protease modulator HflK [Planctomycetia bacterium]